VYSSQDEGTDSESEDECKNKSEDAYLCNGDLMIRRTLHNQPSTEELIQRYHIFHTRCKVLENTCSLIVDSGSCYDYCSIRSVEKLALTILPHPQLYKFNGLMMVRTS